MNRSLFGDGCLLRAWPDDERDRLSDCGLKTAHAVCVVDEPQHVNFLDLDRSGPQAPGEGPGASLGVDGVELGKVLDEESLAKLVVDEAQVPTPGGLLPERLA